VSRRRAGVVEIHVDEVIVPCRFRRQLHDLGALSRSLAAHGQLQPIAVTPARVLIFGQRRLEAARILGWKKIETVVIDPAHCADPDKALGPREQLEVAENEDREGFTASERVAIAASNEASIGERQGERTDKPRQNISEVPEGERTADHVAKRAGLGNRTTYRQAKRVVEHGVPELVAAMDGGEVSISAAAKIADCPSDEQAAMAQAIASGDAKDWRAAERLVRHERRVARLGSSVGIPDGKFRVIYADPPWAYDNSGLDQSAASHYDNLPADEIAKRWCDDVQRVSTPESVLFCWATSPLLPEGLAVVAAWGFEYVASFIWAKDRGPGIGWWANTKHELLLVGRKPKTEHPAQKLDTIVEASVREHSRKPAEFYELIESMYPVSTVRPVHLELFARHDRPGWVRGLYNQEIMA